MIQALLLCGFPGQSNLSPLGYWGLFVFMFFPVFPQCFSYDFVDLMAAQGRSSINSSAR